jgi:L-aminopeptidase/D-esterase-like protein
MPVSPLNSQPYEVHVSAPKVAKGGASLKFDFPALRVGVAEYDEGPTGTTGFYFPHGATGAVDMRGGSPGELNAEILQNASEGRMVQAVGFSGGSWYGLSAATYSTEDIKIVVDEAGRAGLKVAAHACDTARRKSFDTVDSSWCMILTWVLTLPRTRR